MASGGSSPSREVQEILQDYDKNSNYSGDDLVEEDEVEIDDEDKTNKTDVDIMSEMLIKTGK